MTAEAEKIIRSRSVRLRIIYRDIAPALFGQIETELGGVECADELGVACHL